MLDVSKLVAGRIYSFRHTKSIETVSFRKDTVTGAKTHAPEWLSVASITRHAAFKGNLANPESYGRKMRSIDPAWEPSGKEVWFEWSNRNGIVTHKQSGEAYLALINPTIISEQYFVNGIEATPEQTAEIKAFRKGKSNEKPIFSVFNLDESVEFVGEIPIGNVDPEEMD